MKKRLEAELISIAHRILKLKNKSEIDQLYKETQKLYETLAVLKFYQDNFETVKADVAADVLDQKAAQFLEAAPAEESPIPLPEMVEEPVVEPAAVPEAEETPAAVTPELSTDEEEPVVAEEELEPIEEIAEEAPVAEKDEEPAFKPIFELEVEDEIEVIEAEAPAPEVTETIPAPEAEEEVEPADSSDSELAEQTASEMTPDTPKIKVENFLSDEFKDPVFVKPDEVSLFAETPKEEAPKPETANPVFSKSIEIGLNDRIAFVNNLFGESSEDFNRVLSQLNTFDTFEEAKNFINDMVIPDYNYWVGKEEYIERFMEVVEKKFR